MPSGPRGRHRSRARERRAVTPRVLALGILVVVAGTCGVVTASAATLGGIKTTDVGAANGAVAIHTSGITATWTAAFSAGSWMLNGVLLATPGADRFAAGEQVRLALIDSTGVKICELTATSASQSATIAIARAAIDSACGSGGVAFSRIDRAAITAVRS
ncbi:MAG: hypothetical protein V4479_07285 [Actinomycetota bacterium]